MLNKIFKIQLLGTLLFTVLLVFGSCQKEADTLAVIIVKNSYGQTIKNAEVTLDQEWTSTQGNSLDPELKQVEFTDKKTGIKRTQHRHAKFKEGIL